MVNTPIDKGSKKRPAQSRWLAGLFIGLGIIALVAGFYYSGKTSVPAGTAYDYRGKAVVGKQGVCKSEFFLPLTPQPDIVRNNGKKFWQVEKIWPQLAGGTDIYIGLCNGNNTRLRASNRAEYFIVQRVKQKSYLYSKNTKAKLQNLGQIADVRVGGE